MTNIFIISARRSGTHLLTDMIINNFNYLRNNDSIDYDFLTNENVKTFIDEMSKGNKLAWSHYHNYDNFFNKNLKPEHIKKLKEIFHQSKIIYVYRDIRDVIASHYYRPYIQESYDSFIEYYNKHDMRDYVGLTNYDGNHNDIVDTLIEQHKNWFSIYFAKEILKLDMEVISYEEIIMNYKKSLNKISRFLEQSPFLIKDVRLKSLEDKKNDIIYTCHHFRHGKIGDWQDVFCEEWGEVINEKYNKQIGNHVKAYLLNPKLHKFHDPETKYFQIDSQDWKRIDEEISAELNNYKDYFNGFDITGLINNRYEMCERKLDDVRYSHKVFFFDDLVLKYLIPCKAVLDKKTFDHVIPIASKINLLTILKTDKILYEHNMTPKLHYAGIHDGFLIVVQEKFKVFDFVYRKFAINSNWDWIVNNYLFPLVLENFKKGLENNILLTDYISPFNLVFINSELKCVDLDGIFLFKNNNELKSSNKYENQINIFKDIDEVWIQKFGKSALKNHNF